jgi:hypothetical protein
MQVLKFELAADGVLWSEGSGKTSNVYVLKSKDAPPSMASQQQNVQPVLIIPNEPSIDFTVFTSMILMLFVVMSPKAGDHRKPFWLNIHAYALVS